MVVYPLSMVDGWHILKMLTYIALNQPIGGLLAAEIKTILVT